MLNDIFRLIAYCFQSNITLLRTTVISYGGFELSLWDISIAMLVLSAVLMVAFPWFNDDD